MKSGICSMNYDKDQIKKAQSSAYQESKTLATLLELDLNTMINIKGIMIYIVTMQHLCTFILLSSIFPAFQRHPVALTSTMSIMCRYIHKHTSTNDDDHNLLPFRRPLHFSLLSHSESPVFVIPMEMLSLLNQKDEHL